MSFLLTDKAEEAFTQLVTPAALELGAQTYAGKSGEGKVLPCVICSADGDGEEDPPFSGNFWLTVTTAVKHAALDENDEQAALADDQALASAVFQAIMIEELADALAAAVKDFTVFAAMFGAPESGRDEQGVWIDQVKVRIYCAGRKMA